MAVVGEKIKVKGTAIVEGVSRNKIRYTEEALKDGSASLEGVTILKDHEATTDNSVGKVTRQSFDNKSQFFEGWVEEDGTNLLAKIKDQRLKVSVGAVVEKLVREEEDSDVLTAKGIRYMELSLTPTPGVPDAKIDAEGIACDVTESFDRRQLISKLSESEINDILESLKLEAIKDETIAEANKMAEEKEKPQEKVSEATKPEVKVEETKVEAKVEEKTEVKTFEKELKEAETKAKELESKIAETAEVVKKLSDENTKLKEEADKILKDKELAVKQAEVEKMEEAKSKKDVVEEKKDLYEGYVIEKTNATSVEFFKMPSRKGDIK